MFLFIVCVVRIFIIKNIYVRFHRFNAETEKVSPELLEQVVESVMKECNKQDPVYKRFSLSALGDILEVLKIDRFEQVYNTLSDTLAKVLL